jgi:hypothetical protein
MNRALWVLAIVVATPALALQAQWLKYPSAGVPRLPNGQPNLTAPAPTTASGTPDLSGQWLADTESGTGVSFAGAPLPRCSETSGHGLRTACLTDRGRAN